MKTPMTIQVITDITDASYNEMFGIMHGVAEKLSSKPVVIAPVCPVQEFSITHGAFLTRLLAKSYITPTVLFTNVAPHQTYKSDVIGKIKGKDIIFVGSNNGIFDWLVRDFNLEYLVEITINKQYIVNGEVIYLPGEDAPSDYSARFESKTDRYLTFSAHVIYGSIAVALALGEDYKKFGIERDQSFIVPLDIKNGEIVHIDNYGNAKIYDPSKYSPGSTLKLVVNDKKISTAEFINDRMMSHPTNSLVVYPSTSLPKLVDLAMVRGNACNQLKLKIGDVVTFEQ